MLGLAWYEADRCTGCGQSLTESAHPDADEKDYQVSTHTCAACYMLAVRQKAASEEKNPSAVLWSVERA